MSGNAGNIVSIAAACSAIVAAIIATNSGKPGNPALFAGRLSAVPVRGVGLGNIE